MLIQEIYILHLDLIPKQNKLLFMFFFFDKKTAFHVKASCSRLVLRLIWHILFTL